MLEAIANKLAISIKRANTEETASVEVMTYSLGILLNLFATLILTTIFGLIFGKTVEIFTILIAFAVLRAFSGGYHFEKSEYCVIFSTAMAIGLSYADFSLIPNLILTMMSLLLVAWFAPYSKVRNTLIPVKYDPFLKIVSIVIVATNFLFVSSLLSAAFFVQALTLISFHRKG
ncbi:accessory gene regulator B family protein [Paenibacillus flagellatus]|uniref:Accessory regulator AgrB n=1 Tax=Paenibacillus flagellatus TaxID=2211139 RepID=A0A2V5KXE4_9BACL|nr:accessory gene regulator B family protein [Paenibacillus flagellatus]PYI57077.1 accessory regulator AgrB [Paenibacillus flagellatus]